VPRRLGLVLLPALVLTGIAWAMLRINLEERLSVAAQRDLQTLVELVAADLARLVAADPSLEGEALARKIAGSGSLLDRSLQRASEERFRHVYFFDVQGRIVPTGDPAPAVEPPLIVQLALAGPTTQGSLSEPYRDQAGEEVIGAWYWLVPGQLGVVAERPYERLAQPVAWVDGSFAILLAALVAGAFFGGFRSSRPRAMSCPPASTGRRAWPAAWLIPISSPSSTTGRYRKAASTTPWSSSTA